MKNKDILIKLGCFLGLCMTLLLVLPGIPARATEAETAEYELSFTPGMGVPEELDKGNTDFAYLDMENHAKGEAKQAVYQALEEIANSLWGCYESFTPIEGENYAHLATIHTDGLDLTTDELIEVYLMFRNDHPVYYYLSNTISVYGTDLLVLTDVLTAGERALVEVDLKYYIDSYAALAEGDTDYASVKAIHDKLLIKMEYSFEDMSEVVLEYPETEDMLLSFEIVAHGNCVFVAVNRGQIELALAGIF